MMRNDMLALTEGMQHLCKVANRVVASEGKVNKIERDMMLEALRKLYDVAYDLEVESSEEPSEPMVGALADSTMHSSTIMATMAAMAPEAVAAAMSKNEPAVEEKQPEPAESDEQPAVTAESEETVEPAIEVEPTFETPATSETEPPQQPKVAPEPNVEAVAATVPPIMAGVETENALLFGDDDFVPILQVHTVATPQQETNPDKPTEEVSAETTLDVEAAPTATEATTATADLPAEASAPVAQESEQPSLLDYLRHPAVDKPTTATLGDRLGSNVDSGVGSIVKKVDDLRTVININDKFSFMSELFKSDMRGYNDFIVTLNAMTSREEALAYVKEIAKRYDWNETSPTVQTFHKIFDMKF